MTKLKMGDRNPLASIRSKIPGKKFQRWPVKERKAKPKTIWLWIVDEVMLLIKYWDIEEPYYNSKPQKCHVKDEKKIT